ncbi:unnamed protein product [Closterium sp. NIES-53]
MVRHRLVSCLPESLAPLPRSPAPPSTPCVEGQQRAAPHSSSFPPTTAPFQTLHLDVWGPSPVLGPCQERYFLIVVDDYSRYTGFSLAMEGRLRYPAHQLNLWPSDAWPRVMPIFLWTGFPGVAANYRVWDCLAHVRTPGANKLSTHTRAFVFLGFPLNASGWVFYGPVTHQFFASQDVTFDESVSYYRSRPHRGSEAFSPLLFLTLEPPPVTLVAPPPSRPAPSGVSHITPQSSPPQRPVLVVSGGAGGAVAEDAAEPGGVPARGTGVPGGVVGGGSGSGEGTAAATVTAISVGASGESRGGVPTAAPAAAASVGASGESRGGFTAAAAAAAAVSVGASGESRGGIATAAAGVSVGALGEGRGGITAAAVSVGASGESRGGVTATAPAAPPAAAAVAAAALLVGAFGESRGGVTSAAGAGTVVADARGGGAAATTTARPARPSTCMLEPCRSRYRADGLFHLVFRSRVPSPPVLLQPPESSLTVLHDPLSDYLRASRPGVSRVLSALVTHPTAPLSFVSALVTTVVGFASSHRLDYAAHLVSGPACSPSSEGAPVFPLEVLEDRQFELGFLAAAVPHLYAMLLAPEGDPDALDIPIPRTPAEAVSGPYASYWIAAEEAEMASYRSTGT